MPLPRFAKLAPERRHAIIDAARSEFAAEGFASASYNRIIAATGLSKGAMYYYFTDKADLYEAVIHNALDKMETLVRAGDEFTPTTSDDFWNEFTERAQVLNAAIMADPEMIAFGEKLYAGDMGMRCLSERGAAWLTQILMIGRTCDAVRDDIPLPLLAHALTGMSIGLDRYLVRQLAVAEPKELEAAAQHVVALFRDVAGQRTI